jgi:hypothetical protein
MCIDSTRIREDLIRMHVGLIRMRVQNLYFLYNIYFSSLGNRQTDLNTLCSYCVLEKGSIIFFNHSILSSLVFYCLLQTSNYRIGPKDLLKMFRSR